MSHGVAVEVFIKIGPTGEADHCATLVYGGFECNGLLTEVDRIFGTLITEYPCPAGLQWSRSAGLPFKRNDSGRASQIEVGSVHTIYSRRAVCPECQEKIRLEDFLCLRDFPCPLCGVTVGTSRTYRSMMAWTAVVLALVVPYLLGVRLWWVLAVLWLPCMFVSTSLCGIVGKHFLPLRLLRRAADTSILGLRPKA